MRYVGIAVVPLLLSISGVASGQAATQAHEQHQATGQNKPLAAEKPCCCDKQAMQEMHRMMSEMMRRHANMAAHSGHDAAPDKPKAQQKH